jgi:hypothetical protein
MPWSGENIMRNDASMAGDRQNSCGQLADHVSHGAVGTDAFFSARGSPRISASISLPQ